LLVNESAKASADSGNTANSTGNTPSINVLLHVRNELANMLRITPLNPGTG
jgi:hypothetical protein